MDENRTLIIIVCVVVAVGWMLLKKVFNRNKEQKREPREEKDVSTTSDVESWYSKAQDRLAAMDEDLRQEKESEWGELPREEQLKISGNFMVNNFGERIVQSYSDDEKLKVGKAHFLLRG